MTPSTALTADPTTPATTAGTGPLAPLAALVGRSPRVAQVIDRARERVLDVEVAVPPGARAALTALLARGTTGFRAPVLLVTATTREAEDLEAALRCFVGPDAVATFPSWETLPHERLSPRSDTVGRRLAVLRRLAHPDPSDPAAGPLAVVVAPVRALLQPVVRGLGDLVPVVLRPGDEYPLEDVVEALAGAAYTRTDLVEKRGEFAVRGGILDVFPPTEEHPLRVEFWGDTVEEVRWFKVADQRSLEIAEQGLWAPPCRELLLTDEVRARAAELATELPGVADMLGKLAEGIAVEGMESLAPALVDGMQPVLDCFPVDSLVLVSDPERVRTRAHDLVATSAEFLEASWVGASAGSAVPVDLQSVLGTASYWPLAQVREHALSAGRPWWSLTGFLSDTELAAYGDAPADDEQPAEALALGVAEVEPFRGDTEAAVAALRGWAADGWRVVVVTDGPGLARRVQEVLADAGVAASLEPVREDLAPASST